MQQKLEAALLNAFRRNPPDSRIMLVKLAEAGADRFEAEMDEALAVIEASQLND